MRLLRELVLLLSAAMFAGSAAAAIVVPWSQRTTVDSDGDSVPDVFDNAPGVANDQADLDNDLIGDVIDPTPTSSNPYLGDPGLGMLGPYTIGAGSHAFLDYVMTLAAPPGSWGYIDLDYNLDNVYDATYFGPLTLSFDLIDVSPTLFVDALWNLNAPGSYEVHAKVFGPGMSSQNFTVTNVNVTAVPEITSLAFFAIVGSTAGLAAVTKWGVRRLGAVRPARAA